MLIPSSPFQSIINIKIDLNLCDLNSSNLSSKSRLKKIKFRPIGIPDPKQFVVAECSVRDVKIYKQLFDFLDDDNDGTLTPLDLRKNLRECGYKPGRAFVYVAMSVFDADDGGEISFKQFVKLMTQKPYENDTTEDMERIFEYIDDENKGFITPEDLLACAEQLHEDLTLEGSKGDGQIL